MRQGTGEKGKKIPLKSFLADYRSSMADAELMQKYGLTVTSFINLIKVLTQKNMLTAADRELRKRLVAEKELEKESTFLKSLFLCVACGHPHPTRFDICPACGADQSEFAQPEDTADRISTTGEHLYVPEPKMQPAVSSSDYRGQVITDTQGPTKTRVAAQDRKKVAVSSTQTEQPKEDESKVPPTKKRWGMGMFRSLFSRRKDEEAEKK